MHRYRARVALPRADDDWFDPWEWREPDSLTVYEEEPGIEPTGLVGARGMEIVKERVRYPMGFCR